jgi:spore maturation protein CgeB
MNILYIARHGARDNEDEDAITYAMRMLGHTVHAVQEHKLSVLDIPQEALKADFCLINKWKDIMGLTWVAARLPLVFWYWDQVDSTDPVLQDRARLRVQWMETVIPLCKVGFCSDGDWVLKYPRHLVHLMQGSDERYAGMGEFLPKDDIPPILFTGTPRHGQSREEHVRELDIRWGRKFGVVGRTYAGRRHGRDLANVFATTKVVVAPDGPQTDRYCSNRVFLTLGLGGFLLHPYCRFLGDYYRWGEELVCYHNRDECNDLIAYYLNHLPERQQIARAGHAQTMRHHLYRHRCARLVEEVERRL